MTTNSTPGAPRADAAEMPAGSSRLPGPVAQDDVLRSAPARQDALGTTEYHETPVNVAVGTDRRDQVRWGPVWAGLVVALPTFLLLELAFFALGWLTPGANDAGVGAPVISGLIGLFAFFLGGLTAGATAMWRSTQSGLLHGILVWALGVVAFLLLTLLGGGSLFGTLADALTQTAALQRANAPDVDVTQAVSTARDAAGWAVLGLGLSWAAAALGGLLGAKIWPRNKDTDPETIHLP